MHDPIINPTIIGRRQHRFVTRRDAIRSVRTDEVSEKHLTTLGQWLAGEVKADRVSVSLIIRRAVALYRDHVAAMLNEPGSPRLDREKDKVRTGSMLPNVRKEKRPRKKAGKKTVASPQ